MKSEDLSKIDKVGYYWEYIYPFNLLSWQIQNKTKRDPNLDLKYKWLDRFLDGKR